MLVSRKLLYLYAAGLAGCGKSLLIKHVVEMLEQRDDLKVAPMDRLDGDFYHTRRTVSNMRIGIGLNDQERRDWLQRVGGGVATLAHQQHSGMIACSLLKPEYRKRMIKLFDEDENGEPFVDLSFEPFMKIEAESWVIWLDVDPDELYQRVKLRFETGRHWFNPVLVQDQIAAATQERNGRTYIGPIPGEEQNVVILKPTLGPPETADANAAQDARRVLEQIIPGF